MGDIHLNVHDVRVMRCALLGRTQRDDKDIARAEKLARIMAQYEVEPDGPVERDPIEPGFGPVPGSEVNHEHEAQHEAPQPREQQLQQESEADRHEPAQRPDPVGRSAGLGQALKGLIPGI